MPMENKKLFYGHVKGKQYILIPLLEKKSKPRIYEIESANYGGELLEL